MKNNILKNAILAMAWLMFSLPAMAAPGDPPTDEDPDPAAPIDNWIMLLVLAGIALGVYLIVKHNNKKAIA